MKDSEARALVATLAAAFPRQDVPQVTFDVYAQDLADLDAVEASRAVASLRRSARWFPTIAEIRETVAEQQLGAPGPIEAWVNAQAPREERHPLVQEARTMVGDSHDWKTEPSWTLRRDFLLAYAEVRANAVAEKVQASERLELTEGRRELDAGAE